MPTSTVDEVYDYHQQILSWWDEHLKTDASKKTAGDECRQSLMLMKLTSGLQVSR